MTTRKTPASGPVRGLLVGNCLDRLKELPDDSVDAIVTDPPYGLSEPPNIEDVLGRWLANEAYEHGSAGFLNRAWDAFVPGPEVWREALRVLKPGGHAAVFGGTRTVDLLGLALRIAGFRIQDSIHWTYGQGCPRGGRLKPSHEPILVVSKPCDGTIAANRAAWGTGRLNIDDCHIGGPDGRWPSNTLLTHSPNCRRVGDRLVRGDKRAGQSPGRRPGGFLAPGAANGDTRPSGRLHGAAVVPDFECAPDCPVAALARQHGKAPEFFETFEWADFDTLRYAAKPTTAERDAGCDHLATVADINFGARRGRCPDCQRWADVGEGKNCSQCGTRFERESGAPPKHRNFHETVKPLSLMRYLVRLATPADGVVLDPFLGSGTTAAAAILEERSWVGCELTRDYVPIIKARASWAASEVAAGRAGRPSYTKGTPAASRQRTKTAA